MKARFVCRAASLFAAVILLTGFARGQDVYVWGVTPFPPTVYSTFTATVMFSGVAEVTASHVVVTFDPSRMQYVSVANGNVFTVQPPFVNPETGKLTVDQAAFGPAFTGGSGTLFTITFTALQSGTTGINLPEVEFRDEENKPVPSLSGTGYVGPIANPAPTIEYLMPASIFASHGQFLLEAYGTNFVSGAVVRINGVDHSPTTFVASTVVRTEILGSELTAAGVYNVSVLNPTPGGGESDTLPLTVIPSAASKIVFVQQPTGAAAGATISPALAVQLKDGYDNNVARADVPIVIALTSGDGTLSGTTTRTTDATGLATFDDLSINTTGAKRLTASGTDLGTVESAEFTIGAAEASKIVFVHQPEVAIVGSVISPPVTVQLKDAYDNNVGSTGVSIAMALTYGDGILSGTTPQLTDATGLATFDDLSINTPGTKQLTASGEGVGTVISNQFTIDPLPNIYVSSTTGPVAALIYPDTGWDMPATLPPEYPGGVTNDWGFTGTQAVNVYLVPDDGIVLNACSITLQWDAARLEYVGTDFGSNMWGVFSTVNGGTGSATPNGANQVIITGSLAGGDLITIPGQYIAMVSFTLKTPGYSTISVVAQNFQRASPPSSFTTVAHEARVRAYLGDVSSSGDGNTGDGAINSTDLVPWSLAYWSGTPGFSGGMTSYRVKYDVGPTANGYIYTLPTVDGMIEFEDLVIFSISYGLSQSGGLLRLPATPEGTIQASLGMPSVSGSETRIPVMLAGEVADVRALKIEVNGQFGEFLGAEKGELLTAYSTPVMLMSRAEGSTVFVDLAVMGLETQAVARPGEIAVLRFTGSPYVRLTSTIARSSANSALKVETVRGEGELAPTAYELSQNYPNPFNPGTTIEYAIPQEGPVRLVVYNTLGEEVATLVDEVRMPGIYRVQWDGTDNNHLTVATGVYLCRIQAGNFSSLKKMLLLK